MDWHHIPYYCNGRLHPKRKGKKKKKSIHCKQVSKFSSRQIVKSRVSEIIVKKGEQEHQLLSRVPVLVLNGVSEIIVKGEKEEETFLGKKEVRRKGLLGGLFGCGEKVEKWAWRKLDTVQISTAALDSFLLRRRNKHLDKAESV